MHGIVGCFDAPTAVESARFWSSMYKYNGPKGSGGVAHVTGWLSELFPYLASNDGISAFQKNPAVFAKDLESTTKDVKQKKNSEVDSEFQAYNDGFQKNSCYANFEPTPREEKKHHDVPLASIPAGRTSTPFVWNLMGKKKDMVIVAGLFGVVATPRGAVRAELAYRIDEGALSSDPPGAAALNTMRLSK